MLSSSSYTLYPYHLNRHGGHYEKRRMLKRAAQGLPVAKRALGVSQSTMQPEVCVCVIWHDG